MAELWEWSKAKGPPGVRAAPVAMSDPAKPVRVRRGPAPATPHAFPANRPQNWRKWCIPPQSWALTSEKSLADGPWRFPPTRSVVAAPRTRLPEPPSRARPLAPQDSACGAAEGARPSSCRLQWLEGFYKVESTWSPTSRENSATYHCESPKCDSGVTLWYFTPLRHLQA